MSWEMETITHPKARKEYHCQASDWICNAGWSDEDYEPEDLKIINNARDENWKILKGTEYLKVSGKWEGDFSVFRARKDLDIICNKYELYDEY